VLTIIYLIFNYAATKGEAMGEMQKPNQAAGTLVKMIDVPQPPAEVTALGCTHVAATHGAMPDILIRLASRS